MAALWITLVAMTLANPRFEESYARLFGPSVTLDERADDFFAAFYLRFLVSDQVAELFASTDMNRQIGMLKHSLFHLVSFYVTNSPSAELTRLAKFHEELNLGAELFDSWLALWTL